MSSLYTGHNSRGLVSALPPNSSQDPQSTMLTVNISHAELKLSKPSSQMELVGHQYVEVNIFILLEVISGIAFPLRWKR
jgi:hypothetical protein